MIEYFSIRKNSSQTLREQSTLGVLQLWKPKGLFFLPSHTCCQFQWIFNSFDNFFYVRNTGPWNARPGTIRTWCSYAFTLRWEIRWGSKLAFPSHSVIAMDVDPDKVRMAKINANVHGVDHKIEFHVGDFFEISGAGVTGFYYLLKYLPPPPGKIVL